MCGLIIQTIINNNIDKMNAELENQTRKRETEKFQDSLQ